MVHRLCHHRQYQIYKIYLRDPVFGQWNGSSASLGSVSNCESWRNDFRFHTVDQQTQSSWVHVSEGSLCFLFCTLSYRLSLHCWLQNNTLAIRRWIYHYKQCTLLNYCLSKMVSISYTSYLSTCPVFFDHKRNRSLQTSPSILIPKNLSFQGERLGHTGPVIFLL